MEVHLDSDTQAKLNRLALARGTDSEALAREAIAQFVEYDAWFASEVEKGVQSADGDALLTQEEVGARLEKRLAEKRDRS